MNDIVNEWILATEQTEGNPGANADNWAIQKIIEMWADDEHTEMWKFILAVISETESRWVLSCLGAGPLEDLLTEHASDYIDRIANEAKTSPKFKTALSSVWLTAKTTPLYKRVYEICEIEPPFD